MWLAGFSCLFEILFFFFAFVGFSVASRDESLTKTTNRTRWEEKENKINFWFLFIIFFGAVSSLVLTHEIPWGVRMSPIFARAQWRRLKRFEFLDMVWVGLGSVVSLKSLWSHSDHTLISPRSPKPKRWKICFTTKTIMEPVDWFSRLRSCFGFEKIHFVCCFLAGECSMILTFRLFLLGFSGFVISFI